MIKSLTSMVGGTKLSLVAGAMLALLSTSAFAEEETDDRKLESISGKDLPKIETKDSGPAGSTTAEEWEKYNNLEYEVIDHRAGDILGLEPEYVHEVRVGLKLIYKRDYKGARKHYETLDGKFSGTAISSVVDALIWQGLMLENFDFRYDKQYRLSSDQAVSELQAAMKKPGHESWEHFLMAGVKGIDSIHTVRKSQYLAALQQAFDAMDEVALSRKAAPGFIDLQLADGMYNYWRTVLTMSSSMLPDFGDHRAEGIKQMKTVETGGLFLSEPTTLALAFTFIEERDLKRALTSCLKNQRRYPDNVINNMLTGQTYTYLRQHEKALESYGKVLEVSPENNRVHYYRGISLMRLKRHPEAITEFERYLKSDHLEDYQISSGRYRLGQTYYRSKQYGKAEEQYKIAVKESGYKPAKNALSRMKKLKKEGRIDY